ncbi:MAG TPA: glycosyltransferase family 4 protein [Actinomycetota bacterium]|jgi:glycosyltransferase involved in cell wall biosynthesis
MKDAPARVLVVATHPIHYFAPLYAEYAKDPRLDLRVAYCSLLGAEGGIDPEFGVEVAWDVPLLEGYDWVQPANRSPRPGYEHFLGLVNPGLWSIAARGRFDVVVVHGYWVASYWIAGAGARAGGARLAMVVDAHSLAGARARGWKVAAKRAALPVLFRSVDGFLATSSRTVEFLGSLGVPARKRFLTPYVVDSPWFEQRAAAADRGAVRARLGVPPDAPAAVFCGKLVSWKRPGDAVAAVAGVPGLHLIVAGDGELRPALERAAASSGVAERVHFLGFVNRGSLPELYAAADYLVLPSAAEAFGLVVNEAFACGLPAVVSDAVGAVGDLVRDGETGFVVPAGDVAAFTDAVGRLARDAGLRRRLGEGASQAVRAWGPRRNVEAFVQACIALRDRGVAPRAPSGEMG